MGKSTAQDEGGHARTTPATHEIALQIQDDNPNETQWPITASGKLMAIEHAATRTDPPKQQPIPHRRNSHRTGNNRCCRSRTRNNKAKRFRGRKNSSNKTHTSRTTGKLQRRRTTYRRQLGRQKQENGQRKKKKPTQNPVEDSGAKNKTRNSTTRADQPIKYPPGTNHPESTVACSRAEGRNTADDYYHSTNGARTH